MKIFRVTLTCQGCGRTLQHNVNIDNVIAEIDQDSKGTKLKILNLEGSVSCRKCDVETKVEGILNLKK